MHIAIVGCGQLSRMMALAGIPMGLKFSFIADAEEDTRCVSGMGDIVRWQSGDSSAALYQALCQPDVLTAEKEQLDATLLLEMQTHCETHPNAQAFSICQDRHQEKQLLDKLEIPTSPYLYGQPKDLSEDTLTLPVVVKSCRDGYDGKNQWVLKTQQDVDAFAELDKKENFIVEKFIPFEKEVSQVSVRAKNGEIKHYPMAENRHEQGILKESIAPAPEISAQLITSAQTYISRILEALDYVGVMAVEYFVLGDDKLLVNELAPRVHNSGHWTQSGSLTCQFENHLRAIAGLPLGATENVGVTGMVNLIGTEKIPYNAVAENVKVHWYGKTVRPGRKLGHINIVTDSLDNLHKQISDIKTLIV